MALRYLLHRYVYYLKVKPWPTNILTTGVSISVGDIIAQQIIEKRGFGNHDQWRTAQFAMIGCVVVAPSLLTWYKVLDKVIKGTTKIAAIKRVFLDQTFYAPYILAAFYVSIDVTNRQTRQKIAERFRLDYYDTIKNSYRFWPFAQTINFCMVPGAYRILFLRLMAIFWNSYLCWSVHRRKPANVDFYENATSLAVCVNETT